MKRVLKNIGLYLLASIIRILIVIEFIVFIIGFLPAIFLEGIIRAHIGLVGLLVWVVSGSKTLFDISFGGELLVIELFDSIKYHLSEFLDKLTIKIIQSREATRTTE